MRLIECNVKGFGALSDFRVSFDAGVNVIMQPNGWGKTTLAAFIKAMLYGFESRRSRDVMQNERLRYAPWAGGHYGGSLDFESGGREYRVTRSFGKTAAGDKERVVDIETGERVDFMTPTVGEWLFGIDSEAFKKSVFIGQDAFESSWESASLRNRLNSIVNEADDVGGLDGALKVLDDCRKVYKKTGGRGRIADSSAKIATLVSIQTEAEAKIEEVTRLIEARKQAVDQQAALSAAIHTDREKLNGIKDELSRRKTQGEVRAKLEAAVEESEKKLDEFTLNAGKTLPSAESLEIAKRALAAYEEAGGEEAESLSALDDIVERRRALSEGFGGRIPSPEEVDGQKDLVRRWREARDELLLVEGKAAPAERPSFAVFRGDPDAVSQVSGIVADWGEMSASLDRLAKAEREIAVESARWEEQSRRVRDALESVRLKRAALSANADLSVADLRQRAGRLKELDRERVALSAEEDSLKAQIDELAATEALGSPDAEEEFAGLLGQLDEAIGCCSAADEAALAARDAELEYAREKELRRTELEAAREAKESKSTSASGDAGTKRPIAALVACVVAAVALALAGFAARPGSPASIGVWALAAIVAVAGGAIWVRGSKRSGASDEGEECVDQSVEQAEEAYRQASIREESARAATEKTQSEAGLAREALETLLRKPPCEGGSDDASLIARASLAKERLANRITAAEKASRLGKAHAAAEVRLSEIDAEIGKIRSVVDGFDADPDLGAERLAERFEQLAVKIQRDIDEARSEERRLAQALVQLAGVECSSDLSDCEAAAQKALDAPPDTLSRLIDLRRDLRGSVDQYSERVADWAGKLLPKTGSRPSVAENVDVLKGELSAYQSYCREVGEIQKGSEMLRDEIERIGKELASWSNLLGATLDAATNGSLFESLGRVLQKDSRLRWEESEARSRLAQASDRRQALKRQVESFVEQCGMPEGDIYAGLAAVSQAVLEKSTLENDVKSAKRQLEQWDRDSAARKTEMPQVGEVEDGSALERKIAQSEQTRDVVMRQIAQLEERESALLKDLETYPRVKQSVRLLSRERQRDMDCLFTVQKTAEFLSKARSNLDSRYLGDLSSRFVEYANAWIGSDGLDAVVSDDFSVSITRDGQTHSLASYSSGYRDLLGMCFRMALIDTLYEKEKPFLVMDDPFSLLDEGKVGRAFRLLDAVSGDCQIIYFTCHPSRVASMAAQTSESEFVLPEQHARRELPRARARREAEERERAQRELVKSFVVAPVTRGRASITPGGKRRVITNNLFSIVFSADVSKGSGDADFTVSFIDENGRLLCDRQSVSVVSGKAVPERVRFNLSTKEDSGKRYDLVIHEEGRAPNELAARISYRADISFTTDYF